MECANFIQDNKVCTDGYGDWQVRSWKTNTADQEVKEEFYEELRSVIEVTPRRDIIIVFSDLNAKVGRENPT